MSYLDSIEARGNEWLEALAPATVPRVCPYGNRARFVSNCYCVLYRKFVLWDKSAPIGAEVSHERVAEIEHNAARNECPCNVRAPDRATIRFLQHFLER
jgi:hypothetical protein